MATIGVAGVPEDLATWATWLESVQPFVSHDLVRTLMVALGIGLLVYPRLIDLWRRFVSGPSTDASPLAKSRQNEARAAPQKERVELERLFQAAEACNDREAQRVWAAEVKRLLDSFLGPGPTNIHSEAFYEFDFARSHAEKTAVLRSILVSAPCAAAGSGTSRPKGSASPCSSDGTERERSRARYNSIVMDALKSRAGITGCGVMQLDDHSDSGYLISIAFDTTLSAADVVSIVRETFAERLPDVPIFGELKAETRDSVRFAYTYLDEHNKAFKSP